MSDLSLLPEVFFSFETFAHRAIFEKVEAVWEVLPKIDSYLRAQPLGKIEVDIPSSVHLVHPELISIGSGTVVEPGAFIRGPCIIGQDCQVRYGAYVRGGVITGDRCVIGHTTEVKNSLFLDDVSAAHFNYVGDSILGNGVNLGAGVKLANFRLDHAPIFVTMLERRFPTSLKKLGAIVGDHSQLGCNCVVNPGSVLGRDVQSYPCLTIYGYVQNGSCLRSK